MTDVVLGSDTNPGGRKYNEDRVNVEFVTTHTGQRLAVAVLADGVGGEARGERASQLAIDTFMAYLRRGELAETLALLVTAVKEANLAVFAEARNLGQEGRMATTMVAAAVDPDNTLYIANAGDSRIYLCRAGKLIQLTRDHSFANVMVWMGKLTPEAAAADPEASKVMRVLGIHEELQVDVGVYETTTEYGPANHLGREGIKLRAGDSVLLCSDGLIKHTPATGTTLITTNEIVGILMSQEGEKAARAILSKVLGRIPVGEQVDNITVALLQAEDPARAANLAEVHRLEALGQMRAQRRQTTLVAAAVGVPLGLLLIIALAAFARYYSVVQSEMDGTATRLAAVAVAFVHTSPVVTLTVTPTATGTPTPTATPPPTVTLAPSSTSAEVAQVYDGLTAVSVLNDGSRQLITVPVDSMRYVAVTYLRYHGADPKAGADSHLYLSGQSRILLGLVTANEFLVTLLPGSDLFAQTDAYARGAQVQLADTSVVVIGRGCLALHFVSQTLATLDCFGGQCGYSTQIGADLIPIEPGAQVTVLTGETALATPSAIPSADDLRYWNLLNGARAGQDDQRLCQMPNAPATQTARAATAQHIATVGPRLATPTAGPAGTDTVTPAPTSLTPRTPAAR